MIQSSSHSSFPSVFLDSGLPRAILIWAVCTTALVPATEAGAQEQDMGREPVPPESLPRPKLIAFPAQEEVILDGILDEPSWSLADSTDGTLWLTQPTAGLPAPDRTVIRMMYLSLIHI